TNQQTHERRKECHLERVRKGVQIQSIGEQEGVVVEVDLDGKGVPANPLQQWLLGRNRKIDIRKRYFQDDDKRHDEEQQQPQIRQRNDQAAAGDADRPKTPDYRRRTNGSPPPGWSHPRRDTLAGPSRWLPHGVRCWVG